MDKKKIIIVINNLGNGGAEKIVINLLPDIAKVYDIILVTLSNKNRYGNKKIIGFYKTYSLCFTGKLSMIKCVFQLKKIIKAYTPVLIQSHLFYSNIITRLACPRNIPCLNTIHGLPSNEVFNESKTWTFLEKRTLKKYHSILAVSQYVLEDYQQAIRQIDKSFVLPNYVGDEFFEVKLPDKNFTGLQQLRLVAVGNIKIVKNYIYLIEAFKKLKPYNITLDIYGTGEENLLQSFKKLVIDHQLPIQFKGHANNIDEILTGYDLYVMPSISEGCSVAVMEAMVLGLPLLLSDLPVLKEETMNNALFFDISNQQSFIDQIEKIMGAHYDLNRMSTKGIQIAKDNYRKKDYLKNLLAIYDSIIQNSIPFSDTIFQSNILP